jgi:hypothetical protein
MPAWMSPTGNLNQGKRDAEEGQRGGEDQLEHQEREYVSWRCCMRGHDGWKAARHEGRNDQNRSQGLMRGKEAGGDDEVAREKRYGLYVTKQDSKWRGRARIEARIMMEPRVAQLEGASWRHA